MTELELRKFESLSDEIDTMCDMTLRKAKEFAEQYTLHKCGRQHKNLTEETFDLIKIRLVMRIEKEIFGYDN